MATYNVKLIIAKLAALEKTLVQKKYWRCYKYWNDEKIDTVWSYLLLIDKGYLRYKIAINKYALVKKEWKDIIV